MPIAAPLLVPFAELVGITTAGLALSQVSDAVQSYMKANPEQSMKILTMLSPELGIASMMKKKTKKKPEVQEEEVEQEPRLTAEEKREKFIELSKKRGRGRQDFIDLAQDLGLAKKGSEEQPPEDDDEEEQILTGAQKTQLFKNLFREGGAKNIDYARLGRATKRGNQGLYQEGLEALKKTLKGKKDGGRIGYAIGGLTDRAQGIYNSMLAANFDDQTIIDTLNQLGIYNQDTPVVTTPEVTTPEIVNAQPNIINQLSTGRTNNIGSLNVDSFYDATTARQDRLQNPSPFTQKINNIVGKFLPIPRSVPKMLASGVVDERFTSIPLGIGGLLANILPDKYYDQTLGQQAFTQSQMGYTGPTVFGENPTGNYKDPFGYNVRSAFGNYSDFVQERLGKLEDVVEDQLSRGLKNTLQMKELAFRQKQNMDRQNIISDAAKIQELKRQEEIKAAAEREIANQAAIASTVNAFTDTGNSVGRSSDPGTAAAGMGGGSRQATSAGSTKSGRKDGGWGWADGGRVGYQAGGVATPEQYAAALAKVGGGTEADKRRSLGNYLGDYIATQGQKIGNAAIIPFQAAKGVLGIQGTPMTQSMQTSLQNIIQNQIKNTGQLSGNINYKDYGVQTSTGTEFEGFGNRSITDPEAALATTLGRASYSVDPQTGKVNFTGGTAYDFRDDQFGGLGKFISKGGVFGKEATQYNPNISLSSDFLKPYQQTTSKTPLSESDFYNSFWGGWLPGEGGAGSYGGSGTVQQYFKALTPEQQARQKQEFTYGVQYPYQTQRALNMGIYTPYEGPTDYKNYLSNFANGGLATMFSEKR